MASLNPFDLLGYDDSEDPTQIFAAQQATHKEKKASRILAAMARIKTKEIQNTLSIEKDGSNIPREVAEKIFSGLPVKSLLRLKTVCKYWNFIISDPKFAKLQLKKSKKADRQKLFTSTYNGFRLMRFKNTNIIVEAISDLPCNKYPRARLLCSYNGVVLLKNQETDDNMFVLWNPSINVFATFSCPYTIDLDQSVQGICHNMRTDDYKVVLVTNQTYVVYSYQSNSWTKRKSFPYAGISKNPGVCVNGVLHWVGIDKKVQGHRRNKPLGKYLMFKSRIGGHNRPQYNRNRVSESEEGVLHEIIYFDPRDNNFKKFLGRPHGVDEDDVFYLTSLRNNLCLYRNSYDKRKIQIWMMNKYGDEDSWTELVTSETAPCPIHRPLCLTDENEIVMDMEDDSGMLTLYRHERKTLKNSVYIRYSAGAYAVMCLDSIFFPVRKP